MKQPSTIILPATPDVPTTWETVRDTAQHISRNILTYNLAEKVVYVRAAGPPIAGAVAPLLAWVEISPDSVAANFAPVGVPISIVCDGSGNFQNYALPWTTDSTWARLIVQCPGWTVNQWAVWGVFEGRAIVP